MRTETMEAVLGRENLSKARRKVRRNGGAAGVDGKDIDATETHLRAHWRGIEAKLKAGDYVPGAIRSVMIPKATGGSRELGIPTIQDRIIQQAVGQVLSVKLEPTFSGHSYGYRPGRSAHDAVKAAQGYVRSGKDWVVDLDISAFFDEVNHDRLLQTLRGHESDPRVMRLIGRVLRSKIVRGGRYEGRHKGMPQGGPLSPLLANLYLDALDKELESRGLSFCRYADDVMIYVRSEQSAQRVLASVRRWIERHLGLRVNAGKSGTGRPWERQYLGFTVGQDGEVAIAPRSVERFKVSIRRLWDARQSLSSVALVRQWQRFVRGWSHYFGLASDRKAIWRLEGWVRRHMRKCFWLRWHNRKGRLNALKRLGAKPYHWGIASSSRGAWHTAHGPILHTVLSNKVLHRYGLVMPSYLWAA